MISEDNKLANRFSPKRVNFALINDPKSCTSCTRSFSIVCRRHCCSKCNLNFCGKCSKTSVSTIDNNLVRERFCSKCYDDCEKSGDRVDTAFTPSKLHMLNNLGDAQAQILWSADTDSDSENESKNDSVSVSSIKENLMNRIKNESTTNDNKHNKSLAKEEVRVRSSTLISDILSPLSVESTDMVQRKSAQASTSSCTQCKSHFISSAKKHKCSQCNALVCGKCSESRLNTNNKVLYRQRLCTGCISITAPSLISPFTPSKLHTLNDQDISQAHTLWSVDSDTDCESEVNRSNDWKTPSKASALKKTVLLSSSSLKPPLVVPNNIRYSIYSPLLLIVTVVAVLLLSMSYLNLPNEFLQSDSLALTEQSKNFLGPYDRVAYEVLLKAHMANFRKDLDKALKDQVHDRKSNMMLEKRNSQVGFFRKIKNMLHEFDIFLKRVFHKLTHFGRQRNSVHIKIQAKHR